MPGQPGPQDHRHLACRRGNRLQIDERLAQRFVGHRAPDVGTDIAIIQGPPPRAPGSGLLAPPFAHDRRDVEPDERPYVADLKSARPDDLYGLPRGGQRAGYLPDAGVFVPKVAVDVRQKPDLGFEVECGQGIVLDVKALVGAAGSFCQRTLMAGAYRGDRARSPLQGVFAEFRSVRVAGRFV